MNIKPGEDVYFEFFYVDGTAKTGKSGLNDVTVNIELPDGTLQTGLTAMESLLAGWYVLLFSGTNTTLPGPYRAVSHTADSSVAQQDLPSLVWVGYAGVSHLDKDISEVEEAVDNLPVPITAAELLTAQQTIIAQIPGNPPAPSVIRQEIDEHSEKLANVALESTSQELKNMLEIVSSAVASSPIIVTGPLNQLTGDLTPTRGDAYGVEGQAIPGHAAIQWQGDDWKNLVFEKVVFTVGDFSKECDWDKTAGEVTLILHSAETQIFPSSGTYQVIFYSNGSTDDKYTVSGNLVMR